MSGDQVFRVRQFAGSGRGLIALPIMPNNQIAYLEDIASIGYESYEMPDDGSEPTAALITGALDPEDVMFAIAQEWSRDPRGFTFNWPAPGSLWPEAGKNYRVIVTFTPTASNGSIPFILVWQVATKSVFG